MRDVMPGDSTGLTRRSWPALAAAGTTQGIGASLSNVVAGTIVSEYGYPASHLAGGAIAVLAGRHDRASRGAFTR